MKLSNKEYEELQGLAAQHEEWLKNPEVRKQTEEHFNRPEDEADAQTLRKEQQARRDAESSLATLMKQDPKPFKKGSNLRAIYYCKAGREYLGTVVSLDGALYFVAPVNEQVQVVEAGEIEEWKSGKSPIVNHEVASRVLKLLAEFGSGYGAFIAGKKLRYRPESPIEARKLGQKLERGEPRVTRLQDWPPTHIEKVSCKHGVFQLGRSEIEADALDGEERHGGERYALPKD